MKRERTVTFLLTDIVGSTQLLRRLGPRYVGTIDDYRHLLTRIAADRFGRRVDAVGDGLLFVFDTADDAVSAALTGQLALAISDFGFGVRMGIHTGPAWESHKRFVGLTVHKAARIVQHAAAGQILLSDDTAQSISPVCAAVLDIAPLPDVALKDFEDDGAVLELRLPLLRTA
jgi:class 3 adenylate cyclase